MKIMKKHLANGVEVPAIGIGMDQVRDQEQAYESVLCALEAGYRSIDTASSYGNEEAVGKAVRDSGIPREELYITTKLTAADQGYDASLRAFERSLSNLGLDYLDCFLIHWPGKYLYVETWKAFERLYREKQARVIGVCNFNPHHIDALLENGCMTPLVDQVESHPYYPQDHIMAYCRDKQILMEAWSPLMCGGIILKDPIIQNISLKTGRSPAQVVLRWHIQKEHRIFPKSVTPSRIIENLDIFDFSLSGEQMEAVDSLKWQNRRIGPNPDIFFEV